MEERTRDEEDRGDEAKDAVEEEDDAIDCRTLRVVEKEKKTLHCILVGMNLALNTCKTLHIVKPWLVLRRVAPFTSSCRRWRHRRSEEGAVVSLIASRRVSLHGS